MYSKKLKSLSIMTVLFLTAGCASVTKLPPNIIQQEREKVFPQHLTQPCQQIPLLDTSKPLTMGQLLADNLNLMGLYSDCAIRMDTLIEAVRGKKPDIPDNETSK